LGRMYVRSNATNDREMNSFTRSDIYACKESSGVCSTKMERTVTMCWNFMKRSPVNLIDEDGSIAISPLNRHYGTTQERRSHNVPRLQVDSILKGLF